MSKLTSKDIVILENALVKAVSVGCKECGFLQFSFQAGLSLEKKYLQAFEKSFAEL